MGWDLDLKLFGEKLGCVGLINSKYSTSIPIAATELKTSSQNNSLYFCLSQIF